MISRRYGVLYSISVVCKFLCVTPPHSHDVSLTNDQRLHPRVPVEYLPEDRRRKGLTSALVRPEWLYYLAHGLIEATYIDCGKSNLHSTV